MTAQTMTNQSQPENSAVSFKMANALKQTEERTHLLEKKDCVRLVEEPKLDIRDLSFFYGKFKALHNINMQIPDKQVTAFIGPSGCGKSTLLRVTAESGRPSPEQGVKGEGVF